MEQYIIQASHIGLIVFLVPLMTPKQLDISVKSTSNLRLLLFQRRKKSYSSSLSVILFVIRVAQTRQWWDKQFHLFLCVLCSYVPMFVFLCYADVLCFAFCVLWMFRLGSVVRSTDSRNRTQKDADTFKYLYCRWNHLQKCMIKKRWGTGILRLDFVYKCHKHIY